MRLQFVTVSVLALALAGCGGEESEAETPAETPATEMEDGMAPAEDGAEAMSEEMDDDGMVTLATVLADPARADAAARDQYRHPAETLEFFGLEPTMTVIEVTPGGGWYQDVIAPYVGLGGGTYIGADFEASTSERAAQRVEAFKTKYMTGDFGDAHLIPFVDGEGIKAEPGAADMVLTFRNVHNWEMRGYADQAFGSFYAALKPGGVLGVVDHRLPEEMDTELQKRSGYMKQSTVIALAEAAGFVLDAESEINANEMDTADHPYGVWTLPPVSRTPREGEDAPEGFDAEKYLAIGESDRMTLRFVKPAE